MKGGNYHTSSERLQQLYSLAMDAGCSREEAKELVMLGLLSDDPEEIADIEEDLKCGAIDAIISPFGRPPGAEIQGDIKVGSTEGGYVFGLYPDELRQHTLIQGRSGAGKTMLIISIVRQLIAKGHKLLFLDQKRDYMFLLREVPDMWGFDISRGDFRFNAIEPVIPWKNWMGVFANVFTSSHGLVEGASTENILLKRLDRLYRRFDLENREYPCVPDLIDNLYALKRSGEIDKYRDLDEYRSVSRLINRLETIMISIGETVDCSRGYPLEDILARNVVLDLSNMMTDTQSFITEGLLTSILTYKIHRGERWVPGKPLNVIVIDEGKRLLPRSKEVSPHRAISIMSILIGLVREFGVALIVAENDPGLLGNSIKANSYTRICLSLKHGADKDDAAKGMGLKPDQKDFIGHLETGEFIAHIGGRHTSPFLARSLPVKADKRISDREIIETMVQRTMAPGTKLKWTPRVQQKEPGQPGRKVSASQNEEGRVPLSVEAQDLLKHILRKPGLAITPRYRELGFSGSKGNRAKKELLRQGCIVEKGIGKKGRGRSKRLLIPLPKARKYGEILGIKTSGRVGRGSIEHVFYANEIKKKYEEWGYTAEIEAKIEAGKEVTFTDVLAIDRAGTRICVEIALSEGYETTNIRKALEAGVEGIVVVSDDPEILERIKRKAAPLKCLNPAARIGFKLIDDYLDD